ncbi:MAG: hypothetical protein ACMUIA_05950 [bacterium]
MKKIFTLIKAYQTMIAMLAIILVVGLSGQAAAYYQIPTWGSSLGFGWGGPGNYMNFNGYQVFSDPYRYGPAMGVYYPYNTNFNVYNEAYNLNTGYNQNFMGFYNRGNYSEQGQRDINAIGYPLPYGYIDQMAWNSQQSTASGMWGYPPFTSNYMTGGHPISVYYNPTAFTLDMGLDTYQRGIRNFWAGVFQRLNEEDEE